MGSENAVTLLTSLVFVRCFEFNFKMLTLSAFLNVIADSDNEFKNSILILNLLP